MQLFLDYSVYCSMNKTIAFIYLFVSTCSFASAQDLARFTRAQIAGDIEFFIKNAEDIHPNLYHDISKADLAAKTDSLVATLPDELSDMQAFCAFARATAFINEGHTGVDLPQSIKAARKAGTLKMIPLQVTDYDNGYFSANIVAAGNKVSGVKVAAVNSLAASQLFTQLTSLKGGLLPFRTIFTVNSFRVMLAAIGIKSPYVIDYLDKGGKHQVTVDGISEAEYQAGLVKPEVAKSYTFDVIEGQTGYFNFKSMDNYDGFRKFCDSVFESLNSRHINKLIIDLRENSGGNSQLGEYLLTYIATTPFRMAGEGGRKISQQFKDHITANKTLYGQSGEYILKQPTGTFLKMGDISLTKLEDMPHKFKGKVCFITGPNTFSSANMLAAAVKDFHLATLIGEPTGEPANDYGELCTIKLPNTGFSAFTSTTIWVRPNNDKNNIQPIYPDYLVEHTPGEEDNVLRYAINWLAK